MWPMGLLCFFLGISSLWNLNFGLELNIALKNLCCKELRIWDAVCIHCTCLCKSPENSDFIIFSYDRDKKNLLLIKTKVEIRNNLVVLEGCVFHVCLYIFYFVYLMRTMPFNLICGVITDIEHRM